MARQPPIQTITYFISETSILVMFLFVYQACSIQCIEKEPALQPQYSTNLEQSKRIGMFITEYIPDKRHFLLDSVFIFEIDTAWLESGWKYGCIDNHLQYAKFKDFHLIVNASYKGHVLTTYYYLGKRNLGNPLHYKYYEIPNKDTIKLVLVKDTSNNLKSRHNGFPIDTITFRKLKNAP